MSIAALLFGYGIIAYEAAWVLCVFIGLLHGRREGQRLIALAVLAGERTYDAYQREKLVRPSEPAAWPPQAYRQTRNMQALLTLICYRNPGEP